MGKRKKISSTAIAAGFCVLLCLGAVQTGKQPAETAGKQLQETAKKAAVKTEKRNLQNPEQNLDYIGYHYTIMDQNGFAAELLTLPYQGESASLVVLPYRRGLPREEAAGGDTEHEFETGTKDGLETD